MRKQSAARPMPEAISPQAYRLPSFTEALGARPGLIRSSYGGSEEVAAITAGAKSPTSTQSHHGQMRAISARDKRLNLQSPAELPLPFPGYAHSRSIGKIAANVTRGYDKARDANGFDMCRPGQQWKRNASCIYSHGNLGLKISRRWPSLSSLPFLMRLTMHRPMWPLFSLEAWTCAKYGEVPPDHPRQVRVLSPERTM